jgi:hypothetical protein
VRLQFSNEADKSTNNIVEYEAIMSGLHKQLAALKPNRIIRKRMNVNYSSFHLRVFLGLSNPRDRGRLALYLYCVITLEKERLSLT